MTESNKLKDFLRNVEVFINDSEAASEQRFQVLADAIPLRVWTANINGEVDYCNRQWEIYTGCTVEQSTG